MGIRELRTVYGANKKGREAVNAAIRAELAGGPEALDALARIQSRHAAARGNHDPAAADLQIALELVQTITEAMGNEIARRYDLASHRSDQP